MENRSQYRSKKCPSGSEQPPHQNNADDGGQHGGRGGPLRGDIQTDRASDQCADRGGVEDVQ